MAFDDEVRQLTTEACALIEGSLRVLTSQPGLINRHVSAGFLTRSSWCCTELEASPNAPLHERSARRSEPWPQRLRRGTGDGSDVGHSRSVTSSLRGRRMSPWDSLHNFRTS